MENILLIITSENFSDSFAELISYKMDAGFNTPIIFVKDSPKVSAEEIKSHILRMYQGEANKKPFYVLLGGDLNIIPAYKVKYDKSGERYRDSSYAAVFKGENGETEIAPDVDYWMCSIGRLPGNASDEIREMCKKIIDYEENLTNRQPSSLLAIASTEPNTEFLSKLVPNLNFPQKNLLMANDYKDFEAFRNDITDNLVKYKIITYNGHGSSSAWNIKGQFDNVPELTLTPHVMSWACNTANISEQNNFGVKTIKSGAASFWGACAMTYGKDNRTMCEEVLKTYVGASCPQTIGELYFQVISDYPECREALKYMLLGDPTLKIRQ